MEWCMGSVISKGGAVLSKCTKCCPKGAKCCSKASRGSKSMKGNQSLQKHQHSNVADAPAPIVNDKDKGGDCFSSWWDGYCCTLCAPLKSMFVANKAPKESEFESEFLIQRDQNSNFLDNVRIHPEDALCAKSISRSSSPSVPEPMTMVLKI